MSASTGPIIAAGAIAVLNDTVVNAKPISADARIIVGTGVAAVMLFGIEEFAPDLAVALAWAVLVSALFVPLPGSTSTPASALADWLNKG